MHVEQISLLNYRLLSNIENQAVIGFVLSRYNSGWVIWLDRYGDRGADLDSLLVWSSTNEGLDFWSCVHLGILDGIMPLEEVS